MENEVQKKSGKNLLLISMLTTFAGSVLMIISLFLPYITGGTPPLQSCSMVSYVQLALDKGNTYLGTSAFGEMMLGFVASIGLFALLSLILSLAKKPISVIIFTILAGLVFYVMCVDFTDRGVVAEGNLSWGIAYYTYIIGTVISLGGSVFMITQKKK